MHILRTVGIYVLIGWICGILAGTAVGAALVFINNHFLTDVPQGSYGYWICFFSLPAGIISAVAGACAGLAIALHKKSQRQ